MFLLLRALHRFFCVTSLLLDTFFLATVGTRISWTPTSWYFSSAMQNFNPPIFRYLWLSFKRRKYTCKNSSSRNREATRKPRVKGISANTSTGQNLRSSTAPRRGTSIGTSLLVVGLTRLCVDFRGGLKHNVHWHD